MAAGSWTFTETGRTSLLNGTFNLDTDTFRIALFRNDSNLGPGSTSYAGVSNEVATGFGYTQNAKSVTLALSGTSTVTVDETTNPVWTANSGSIVARFAAIYEVSGNILCYCLLDSAPADVTVTAGNTLTITMSASGLFTLA